MRVLTVAELKASRNTGDGVRRDYPADGTYAWDIWQALKDDIGHAVDLRNLAHSRSRLAYFNAALAQLIDMYGLDIRRVKPRQFLYILAGEWFGSHYSDYCAEAFAKGEMDDQVQ